MRYKSAFTLIELLVVIMIIGVLVTMVTFGLRQAQQSARDGKRKADLETIATGLELYRAECNGYPTGSGFLTGDLTGSGTPASCNGTYISAVAQDPLSPTRRYSYSGSTNSYVLCAALEQGSGTVSGCGSGCGSTCNYRIARP